jgi:hypothetical protein
MDTGFDFGLGEFGIEVVCGPWTSFNGVVVSDFWDIIYPFSTMLVVFLFNKGFRAEKRFHVVLSSSMQSFNFREYIRLGK